ncbi:MAG: alcohol dehydrogenase catalytic domain-containing protein, partial [Opitutales bacterium]|nr:alcohol dehydrogenase catalytic domain-containing protein [Opitutales bacterium]
MKTASYAAEAVKDILHPYTIERRELHDKDVLIEIDYCGVCHTDLHFVNNDWGMTEYPVVPGHEIVGKITEVGSSVSKF